MSAIPSPSVTAAASNTNTDLQTIPKFESADIDIRVTQDGKVAKWKVCSYALVLASPVWKLFVFPPFPRLPEHEKEGLDFQDDDSSALLVLLKIAHLQFTNIPAKRSYEELLNLAILCDKYDCVRLVKPWVSKWCHALEQRIENWDGKEDYLFVAWVFGRKPAFTQLVSRFVLKVKTNEKSECLNHLGEKVSHLMPEQLAESLLKVRADTIKKLLDLYLDFVAKYADTTCKNKSLMCSTMLCGSITRPLIQLRVLPMNRAAHRYFGSIDAFSSPMKKIQVYAFNGHSECKAFDAEIRRQVLEITRLVLDAVLPCHYEHFTKELLELGG